ncbi:MAG TPA: mechanosensitive ion channel domain-containing protein [Woeseiaceae bacterium]|jgi:small-conductance mechanosensitive channel|nr:mechanosensitive ion channel domain-containing protein [Woeseiaceae bacterium]
METLRAIWNFELFSIGGSAVLVSQLVLILFVIVGGYIVSKLIERIIQKRLAQTELRADAAYLLQRIIFYTLIVVVIMTALALLNVPLAAFAFVSGAVAIGVGFGAQNIINNFISGWILLMERPIRIGDFIEIDDSMGVVERIGNRSTRILRVDGVHMMIPNSQLLERVVVNWTLVDKRIRTIVRVGVAYGSPVRKVAELIRQAVSEEKDVMTEPAPSVVFDDFGDNALIFDVYFWAEVGGERFLREIRSSIRFRIDELFREHDITIAFPQRDVHMSTLAPLEVRVVDSGSGNEGSKQ